MKERVPNTPLPGKGFTYIKFHKLKEQKSSNVVDNVPNPPIMKENIGY